MTFATIMAMEIDHQSEAGNTGESEIWMAVRTAPW